jgi:hypothetical protein
MLPAGSVKQIMGSMTEKRGKKTRQGAKRGAAAGIEPTTTSIYD